LILLKLIIYNLKIYNFCSQFGNCHCDVCGDVAGLSAVGCADTSWTGTRQRQETVSSA